MENIMTSIETIGDKLKEIKEANREQQRQAAPGSTAWRRHETIDDRVHEILVVLGQ